MQALDLDVAVDGEAGLVAGVEFGEHRHDGGDLVGDALDFAGEFGVVIMGLVSRSDL